MKTRWLVVIVAVLTLCFSAGAGSKEGAGIDPEQALQRLRNGNRRYAAMKALRPHQTRARRTSLAKGQQPFAVVVSCADSRVPPEIIFDQGLGDLFVLRVAGNIVDDHSLGSIEYAVDHLAVRLIVVLGHQRCGAVKAAKETIAAKGEAPAHIQSLVTAIQPA